MSTVTVVQGDLSGSLKPRPTVLADGDPIDANWTCQMRIIDPAGTVLIDRAVTEKDQGDQRFLVYLSVAETTTLPVDTYTWVIELANSTLTPVFNVEQTHILEVDPQYETGPGTQISIEKGVNSFDTYENLLRALRKNPSLTCATNAARDDLKAAMDEAWNNIGNLVTDFEVEDADGDPVYSTRDFDVAILDALDAEKSYKLVRSQLIEADFLLGGNPIEQRRRMGLMSDSTGESAHFMRPTKPVELAVCRDAAMALSPYVMHTAGIGRA